MEGMGPEAVPGEDEAAGKSSGGEGREAGGTGLEVMYCFLIMTHV